jgi:uncharacterized protein (TIGR02391 family)
MRSTRSALGSSSITCIRVDRSGMIDNVISLDAAAVRSLPVDELAMTVLADLVRTKEWNEYNYLNSAVQDPRYAGDESTLQALAEGLGWLRSRGLIARSPGTTADAAIFVTRAGELAIKNGLRHVRAAHRLQDGLHPLIERKARPQFLLGEYEQAVFVAMKAVEIRVRALGGFSSEAFGVPMINQAFGPNGSLTDTTAAKGEQDGARALFAGAYAVLRNPSGHRDVDYDDVAEAAEAVVVASLLMRILDRVEQRPTS